MKMTMALITSTRQLGIRDEVVALKRARIIAASVELFYENGYQNTTLDTVAERLGVTKPFIYAHFTSKSELLAEICARGIAASIEAIDSVLPLRVPATEKLRLLGERFVTAVLGSQMHIAIFSREEKNLGAGDLERINDMRRAFDRKLTALLQRGIETGEFSVPDIRLASLAIGGMVSWAYVWYRADGALSLEQVSGKMSRLILRMVSAKTGNDSENSHTGSDRSGRSSRKAMRKA
jgi:AcrR family transcriptional regulator